ncbi:MAG: hypothetical protein RLZZ360_834 [Candidatus Parcubacteria bacterium]|jgi:hypothetical protein
MVRTRDFVLFLLSVAVLLLAIMGTELWHKWRSLPLVGSFLEDNTAEVDYAADVPTPEDNRTGRLETLRAKVMARLGDNQVTESEPEPEPTEPTAPAATTTPTAVATVKTCAGYRTLTLAWTPQQIVAENREGARVYFERGVANALSSTTPETIRTVISLRSWPSGTGTCLPTDIIGIATDGSLIRNNELALYTVFGGDSLVGYSLDGFPIYGPSPVATDACGGAIVGGQYRYVLDVERPGLITCFAASPTTIN